VFLSTARRRRRVTPPSFNATHGAREERRRRPLPGATTETKTRRARGRRKGNYTTRVIDWAWSRGVVVVIRGRRVEKGSGARSNEQRARRPRVLAVLPPRCNSESSPRIAALTHAWARSRALLAAVHSCGDDNVGADSCVSDGKGPFGVSSSPAASFFVYRLGARIKTPTPRGVERCKVSVALPPYGSFSPQLEPHALRTPRLATACDSCPQRPGRTDGMKQQTSRRRRPKYVKWRRRRIPPA